MHYFEFMQSKIMHIKDSLYTVSLSNTDRHTCYISYHNPKVPETDLCACVGGGGGGVVGDVGEGGV